MITRSYFLLSISQLCKTIVCLFPRFLNDIRFRMTDAKRLLNDFYFPKLLVLTIFWLA